MKVVWTLVALEVLRGVRHADRQTQEPLDVNDQVRNKWEMWARQPKGTQRLGLRYRIVLRCAERFANQVVAVPRIQRTGEPTCRLIMKGAMISRSHDFAGITTC